MPDIKNPQPEKQSRRSIGNAGEDIAVQYLESKWYKIIERNYQIKGGEIDIIAKDNGIFVFMEVRYRVNEDHGHPLDSFGVMKRRAMRRTLMLYVNKNKINLEQVRVDFIGIMPKTEWGHRVWHAKGVEI